MTLNHSELNKFRIAAHSDIVDKDPFAVINTYSQFLCDGDFEKYQKDCYLNKSSKKFHQKRILANRMLLRAMWIKQRYTRYLEPEWAELNYLILRTMREIDLDIKVLTSIKLFRKKSKEYQILK